MEYSIGMIFVKKNIECNGLKTKKNLTGIKSRLQKLIKQNIPKNKSIFFLCIFFLSLLIKTCEKSDFKFWL